ncbi:MAG: septal ring lytic transglycosylase RlpA family protein, partial [Lautropia sp.]|nr:septal ring lytic transglycosylase RlpA family protein [Lautropia sp.]
MPVLVAASLLLSGCAGARSGGYYLDDGPGKDDAKRLARLMAEPDPVPVFEKLLDRTNRPYRVMGQDFTPMTSRQPYRMTGVASWYGKRFHGRPTSTGEVYDMYQMTAAHPTLPLPSYARVRNLENGREVIVRVNDRGPFLRGRLIDLSYLAANKLGYVAKGHAKVEVELLNPQPGQRHVSSGSQPGAQGRTLS